MEQLIRDLNSPQNQGRPDAINTIQRQLQRLQKDSSAWQLSLVLLDNDEQLLQFYGALTLAQKVNADWERDGIGQDRNHVSHLLEQLLRRYVELSISAANDLVIAKLSSALAAIFAKPGTAWAHPCRHVLSCMVAGQYVAEMQSLSVEELLRVNTVLPSSSLKACLRLASALQEEAGSSNKSQTGHRFDLQLSNNGTDVWQMLRYTLAIFSLHMQSAVTPESDYRLQVRGEESTYQKLLGEALQQLPLWCKVVAAETDSPFPLFHLFQTSLAYILPLLDQPALAEHCVVCITALQTEHYRLLRRAVSDYRTKVATSRTAQHLINSMLNGSFSPESNSYVEFLEAIVSQLDCTTDEFLQDIEMIMLLKQVQSLTRCKGAAMVEDEACQVILEIMTTVAEGYSDWSGPSDFDESMTALIKDVCLATMVKVQYPESELSKESASWDDDDYTRFEDYRFQAKDFFETAFGILGPSLAQEVAQAISQAHSSTWSEFESTLFLLIAVSDALSNDPEQCDPALSQLFSSTSWTEAVSDSTQVPARVRRSVIRLLAEITSYLERNPQYMISSLDFLFRSLKLQGHSNHAARAIFNLCDNQRTFLTQALPQFLDTMTTLENIPLHSRCKVLSGVAALVQALPTEETKIAPLQKMLHLIRSLETGALESFAAEQDEEADPWFDRLSMLAAVAKGLQSPADSPVDLDAVENRAYGFWTNDSGEATQAAVLQMLAKPWSYLLQPDRADLVAAACDLLRAEFKEQYPSPLKFSASTNTQLLCSLIDLKNPNLDQTMNTASCFVSSSPRPTTIPNSETDAIIERVLAITKEATRIMTGPIEDTTFNAPTSILDFVNRSLPKYGQYMLSHHSALDIMKTILDFGVLLLKSSTDTLPRRVAATFFTSFLDTTEPTSAIMQDSSAQANMNLVLDNYASSVLGLTFRLLAGDCLRSEIDVLTQLLRAFVSKQPMRSRKIMQKAIMPDSGVLTQKAMEATKPEQRSRFIAQVDGLRGGRKTNEIAKDFWINCRGGQFGYVT